MSNSPASASPVRSSSGQRMRDLMARPGILPLPCVYDGFSARLVQSMGFQAAGITGSGLSETNLGWPDVGIMGFEENVRSSGAIAACCDMALTADADTGYGNAINVYFTVQGFERAGLAGLMLEDQVWPKRCGHMAGKQVIPAEEQVEKIRAAAEARRDPAFVIRARTDSTAIHGLADAIRRLNMYAEAGADVLFADALLSADDIRTVAREVIRPLAVNMGFGIRQRKTTPLLSARQLEDMGVKIVSYPRLLTAAAIQGMKNAMAALRTSLDEGIVVDRPDLLVSFEELNDMMGIGRIHELEARFVTAAQAMKPAAE